MRISNLLPALLLGQVEAAVWRHVARDSFRQELEARQAGGSTCAQPTTTITRSTTTTSTSTSVVRTTSTATVTSTKVSTQTVKTISTVTSTIKSTTYIKSISVVKSTTTIYKTTVGCPPVATTTAACPAVTTTTPIFTSTSTTDSSLSTTTTEGTTTSTATTTTTGTSTSSASAPFGTYCARGRAFDEVVTDQTGRRFGKCLNTNLYGSDYASAVSSSQTLYADCLNTCSGDNSCVAFSVLDGACYYKRTLTAGVEDVGDSYILLAEDGSDKPEFPGSNPETPTCPTGRGYDRIFRDPTSGERYGVCKDSNVGNLSGPPFPNTIEGCAQRCSADYSASCAAVAYSDGLCYIRPSKNGAWAQNGIDLIIRNP